MQNWKNNFSYIYMCVYLYIFFISCFKKDFKNIKLNKLLSVHIYFAGETSNMWSRLTSRWVRMFDSFMTIKWNKQNYGWTLRSEWGSDSHLPEGMTAFPFTPWRNVWQSVDRPQRQRHFVQSFFVWLDLIIK